MLFYFGHRHSGQSGNPGDTALQLVYLGAHGKIGTRMGRRQLDYRRLASADFCERTDSALAEH